VNGEDRDEGEESLEDLGLYTDTLRHVVIHCLEIARIAKRETARKAMRLEGAEGNDDNFGIFRCEAQRRGDPTSGTDCQFGAAFFGEGTSFPNRVSCVT
jgi:hypothetical protein